MPTRIAVIGAGMAGLCAAADLARQGFEVVVLERASTPGGKMRQVNVLGRSMDAGPTVLVLRAIFDALFADANADLNDSLSLLPARVLARHAWSEHERLDLYADVRESADAIGVLAGKDAAASFLRFAAQSRAIYDTLARPFMQSSRPSPLGLVQRVGLRGLGDLWNIQPFATLSSALERQFADPRLRQLFGRYATYCGSSPFESPATLMLIAHAEQSGVWYVEGGMHRLAEAIAALAISQGAQIRYGCAVERIHLQSGRVCGITTQTGERLEVDAVISNADNAAIAAGLFGEDIRGAVTNTAMTARSLSAVTWNLSAQTSGFDLVRHNVFFSADYRAEFDDIFERRRLPVSPTVYVCAQDRTDSGNTINGAESLLCLVNAPANGDTNSFDDAEIERCETTTFGVLRRCGLQVQRTAQNRLVTTPADFNRLFPATGGALYGPASHGWRASFIRPGSRSKIPGLYLAGGSTHPGAGVPMAATSGRLAAASIVADHASITRSPPAAMRGGTSMR